VEGLAALAIEQEAVVHDAKAAGGCPESQLKQIFMELNDDSDETQTRTRLLVRELLDVGSRPETAKHWYLRDFLDQLMDIAKALPAWSSMADAQVFANLYQLLGAISYFAISKDTLNGMLGARRSDKIYRAFDAELPNLLDLQFSKTPDCGS